MKHSLTFGLQLQLLALGPRIMVVLRQLFSHRLKSNRNVFFPSNVWQSHRWNVRHVNWIEATHTLVPWQGHTAHVQGFGSEGRGSLKRQLHATSKQIIIVFDLVLTYIFLHLNKDAKINARPPYRSCLREPAWAGGGEAKGVPLSTPLHRPTDGQHGL